MGREGIAFTFIAPGEGEFLTAIEHRINKLLQADILEGFDPCPLQTARKVIKMAVEPSGETTTMAPQRRLNPMQRRSSRRR
jgi:ATP-dependent RNA helicase DeaD